MTKWSRSFVGLFAVFSVCVNPCDLWSADERRKVFQNQLHTFSGTTRVITHALQMGYDYIVGHPWSSAQARAGHAAGLGVLYNTNKEYPKYIRFNADATTYNKKPITRADEANFNNMFCMRNGGLSRPLKDRFYTWKKTSAEIIFYANMQCRETPPLLVEYNKRHFEEHGGTNVFDGVFIDGVGNPTNGSRWYLPCYNPCLNGGADYTQRQGEIEYIKQMKKYFIDQLGLDGISGNPWAIFQYNDAWPSVPIGLLYSESGIEKWNNPATWGNVPATAVSLQLPFDGRRTGIGADYPTALKTLGVAGVNKAWFGWYGEARLEDSTNSTQLARAIPNWDNLVGATGRSWDSSRLVYRSSNSYADPNIIYGRHAKNGHLFVVFQNNQGVLQLKPGEVVTSVKLVDDLFVETVDGSRDLIISGSSVRLGNAAKARKGYVITTR